jgi:hypothetical protein
MTIDDKLAGLVAPVVASPNIALKVARISLEARAHELRTLIRANEKRVAGTEGPIPDACHLLTHTYRRALAPINEALLALATEGEAGTR